MRTAGVFLKYQDQFAFMVEPNKENTFHGVVRFGGHLEANETAAECAIRETMEEAAVAATLLSSAQTFFMSNKDTVPIGVIQSETTDTHPILVSGSSIDDIRSCAYLSTTCKRPKPSSETQGIVLLSQLEIRQICDDSITLGMFLDSGGTLIEKVPLRRDFRLVPYLQLRFLNWAIVNSRIHI